MKTAKKKPRPSGRMQISALAAKLLGHSRVAEGTDISAARFGVAFPAFNTLEMTYALTELVDKKLMKQRGEEERASYTLTDAGRTGAISVS